MAEEWFHTIPAQITLWGTAVLVLGAVIYKLWQTSEKIRRIVVNLLSIGITPEWPNGSIDLPSSLKVIYEMVEALDRKLDKHLDEHREPADHAID